MDKVIGGTPKGSRSLCLTCRAAHNIIGVNMQTETFCRAGTTFRVRFPVSQCSAYDDKRIPSLFDMQQIAWEVHSKNRGQVGFAPDEERTEIVITPPDPNKNQGQPGTPPVTGAALEEKP